MKSPSLTVCPSTVNCFRRLVDLELAGADNRRLAHLATDDRGVRGHAAGGGENPLRHEHAVDVVGHGLAPHEDDRLALVAPTRRRDRPRTPPARSRRRATPATPWSRSGSSSTRPDRSPGASSWLSDSGSTSRTASFGEISFSATRSVAMTTAAKPVRLPLRVCSMNSRSSWMVNSKSWTSL